MASKEELFHNMIDEKLPMFRSVALRIVGNCADADDAVQQALISAWRKQSTFRNEARFSNWVTSIVINESYNILSKRMREKRKISEATKVDGHDPQSEMLERLELAVAELPGCYRETLELALLSGHTSEEAAEMLNCSTNTLYQRIHKAKNLLRQKIMEAGNE